MCSTTLKTAFTTFIVLILIIFLCGQTSAGVYFQDDFEDGDLSKYSYSVPEAQIASKVVHSGTKALHIPYDVPAGEPAHQDCNRFVQKDMSAFGLHHFFVRGYFYLASTPAPTNQRKLYYIWGYPQTNPEWDLVVSVWGGIDGSPLSLWLGTNIHDYSDLSNPVWNIAEGKVQYDQWYCLEVELKLNTPGKKDGLVRLWLDGNLEYERTGISIRADSKPLGIVRIGAQINRNEDTLERHEDRYWDDIAISDTYNGPIGGSGSVPSRPLNLRELQ